MSDTYTDGLALQDAAKAQAKRDPVAAGVAIQTVMTQLVFDRFLCRIFSEPGNGFALKGGAGMLARIPRGRATQDVDLEHGTHSIRDAVAEITRLAAIDLGDFHRFTKEGEKRFVGDNQPGVEGRRITFSVEVLGPVSTTGVARIKRQSAVSVDLAIQGRPTAPLIRRPPANRLHLSKPLVVHDYVMISVEDQIADKAAAMMDTSYAGGEGSSRAKDLVDIVLLANHESVDANLLRQAIVTEQSRRGIAPFTSLTAGTPMRTGFSTMVKKTSALPNDLAFDDALRVANALVEPALTRRVERGKWSFEAQAWQTTG